MSILPLISSAPLFSLSDSWVPQLLSLPGGPRLSDSSSTSAPPSSPAAPSRRRCPLAHTSRCSTGRRCPPARRPQHHHRAPRAPPPPPRPLRALPALVVAGRRARERARHSRTVTTAAHRPLRRSLPSCSTSHVADSPPPRASLSLPCLCPGINRLDHQSLFMWGHRCHGRALDPYQS